MRKSSQSFTDGQMSKYNKSTYKDAIQSVCKTIRYLFGTYCWKLIQIHRGFLYIIVHQPHPHTSQHFYH